MTTRVPLTGVPRLAAALALAAAAALAMVWATGAIVQSASRTAGAAGTWAAAQNLSATGSNASAPRVAVGGTGVAVATWQRGPSPTVVQAAARPSGGAWSPGQTISTTDTTAAGPAVAADAVGNAVAAWPGSDGASGYIRASGFDGVGPRFDNLTVPASGTAAASLSFSVSPFDVWSALGPGPVWSFGDGGTAAGNAVTHVYSSAGSYQVTITQADAVGNTTSATRRLAIAAPAPPPPPPPPPVKKCLVPKVVGKPLAKARAALRRRHCRAGRITRAYSKRIRKGRVVAQRPRAGRTLKGGSKVRLVVSRGKKPARR